MINIDSINIKLHKLLILFFTFLSLLSSYAQENTFNEDHIKKIDALWEQAQLELNSEFIESLLGENFIWVHNHANVIDDKGAVLERINRYITENNRNTKSRNYKNVKVIISGKTAIVTGLTTVEKGLIFTTYHFMRTYIETNGKCYLIANQSMAIPEK